MTRTVDDLLQWARRALGSAPFSPPRREASLLLRHVLGWSEAAVLSRGEATVDRDAEATFEDLVRRRVAGEPVAYLFGEREFYGRPFLVDPRVLIPRPETEHLVESVLGLEVPSRPLILDIGTGSGSVGVTLACEIAAARIVATDSSPAALAVARANAAHLGVGHRVRLVTCDLATAIDLRTVDVVVSNPPYVDPLERSTLSTEITEFEPHQAVFAPGRGESVIGRLLRELEALRPGCHLLFEIGSDQPERVRHLASASHFEILEIRQDLAGRPRIAIARRR